MLEGINDHENLGAIARTARGLGADALLLDPTCADPFYRRSVRVSMGELLHLPIVRCDPWSKTFDVTKAVNELKAGKIEFRVDKGSNVHAPVGKASFSEDKLLENAKAFLRELMRAKPAGAKGHYVRSLTMSSTMGPAITLDASAVTVVA